MIETNCILPISVFAPTHWLALTHAGATVDVHENYPKQTYRNRYVILGANGIQTLTLPVVGQKGQKTPTKDIRLSAGSWGKQHLSAIRSAYGRSAFFEHFFPEIEAIYNHKHPFLVDFAQASNSFYLKYKYLGTIAYTDQVIPFNTSVEHDFRTCFEPLFQWPNFPKYPQVFSDRYPFHSSLSGIDLLMNLGPRGADYLLLIKKDCLIVSKS